MSKPDTLDAIAREMIAETETNKSGFGVYPKIRGWAGRLRNLLVSHAVESTNIASTEQANEERQRTALSNQGEGAGYERAYQQGYRAALGAASSECRRIGEALDHAGNTYVRYEDAIKCAVSVSGLRVPSIAIPAEADRRDAEFGRSVREVIAQATDEEWSNRAFTNEICSLAKAFPVKDAATQEQT